MPTAMASAATLDSNQCLLYFLVAPLVLRGVGSPTYCTAVRRDSWNTVLVFSRPAPRRLGAGVLGPSHVSTYSCTGDTCYLLVCCQCFKFHTSVGDGWGKPPVGLALVQRAPRACSASTTLVGCVDRRHYCSVYCPCLRVAC